MGDRQAVTEGHIIEQVSFYYFQNLEGGVDRPCTPISDGPLIYSSSYAGLKLANFRLLIMVRVVFFVIWTFACAQWVFCLVSLLLICAHSFLATVSETRHTAIQNTKNPSKKSGPKIDLLWPFWYLGHFLDVCFCLMSFLPCESLTYLRSLFSGYSVWNPTHTDPEMKNPSRNYELLNWSITTTILRTH